MRPADALLTCLLVVPACCLPCEEAGPLEDVTRELGVVDHGGLTVTFGVKLTGQRSALNRNLSQHESWSLWDRVTVRRAGQEEEPCELRRPSIRLPGIQRRDAGGETAARALFDRVVLQHCARGADLVFRVHDPAGDGDEPWGILHGGDRVVRSDFELEPGAGTCEEAAAAAPTRARTLALGSAAGRVAACRCLEVDGERALAMRCALGASQVDRELEGRLFGSLPEDGDAQAALYAALSPAPDEPDRLPIARIVEQLARAPNDERKRAHFAAVADHCAGRRCAAWRLQLLGRLAEQLGDVECGRAVEVTAATLSRSEAPEAARSALGGVRGVAGCATPDQMRGLLVPGLTRPSNDPAWVREVRSGNPFLWNQCREVGGGGDGHFDECTSLPRHAGTWLARNCHEDAVSAALAALGGVSAAQLDPTADTVQDGALRVLSRCAPAQLTERFGDLSGPGFEDYHRPPR